MKPHHTTAALVCSLLLALAGCATSPATQRVQVGDKTLAYTASGQTGPVAVFQSGLGDDRGPWAAVLQRYPGEHAVFAYDRPGYGSSPAVPGPRSPCAIADELHQALHAAGVAPPYLLVGHSIGGLYQYAFTLRYPQEVAGLLLLDPTHPEHWATMQAQTPALATLAKALRKTVFSSTMAREFDDQAACLDGLRALQPPAVPVRLLVRSRFEDAELPPFPAMVRGLEQGWLTLLPQAHRTQVEGAGHYIHRDRPEVVVADLAAMWSVAASAAAR